MKKNNLLLVIFIMFILFLTSCSTKDDKPSFNIVPRYRLKSEKIDSDNSFNFISSNSKSYYCASQLGNEIKLEIFDTFGLKTSSSFMVDDAAELEFFEAGENGCYLVVRNNCDEPWNSVYEVLYFDLELNLEQQIILNDTVADEAIDLATTPSGNVYLLFPDLCVFINDDLIQQSIYIDEFINAEAFVAVSSFESSCYFLLRDGNNEISLVKTNKKCKLEKKIQLEIPQSINHITSINNEHLWNSPGFIINDSLCLYNADEECLEQIVDFKMNGFNHCYSCSLYNDSLLISAESNLIPYTPVWGLYKSELVDLSDASCITIDVINNAPEYDYERMNRLNLVVTSYNSTNNVNSYVQINLIENKDDSLVKADIVAGNGPDILCVSSEDLYSYIGSEYIYPIQIDSKVESSCIDSLIESQKVNGELLFLAPWVHINGLSYKGTSNDFEGINSVKDFLQEIIKSNQTQIVRHSSPGSVFDMFIPYLATMEDDIESDQLQTILEYSKNSDVNISPENRPLNTYIMDDDLLFLSDYIDSFYTYLYYANLFDCDIETIGYPGLDAPIASSDDCFLLLKDSSIYTEDFFDFLLSYDVQYEIAMNPQNGFNIPIQENVFNESLVDIIDMYKSGLIKRDRILYNNDSYNDFVTRYMSDYEIEKLGEEIQVLIDDIIASHNNSGNLYTNHIDYSLNEEESVVLEVKDDNLVLDSFVRTVNNVHMFYIPNQKIVEVYREEVPKYFDGAYKLADILPLLVDRTSTIKASS